MPNQHGAWAMLATPLLVGVLASSAQPAHVLLAAFWFCGYFAFFATGLWLKSRRRPRYAQPVRVYVATAVALGALLLAARPDLVRWAPLFVIPLGVGLYASATRDERSLWSGLTTAIGSSLMTVVAYDVGGGTDWRRAWLLTAVLAAYFAGTVFYVKSVIRERGNTAYLVASVLFHALATTALLWLDPALAAVFAVLTLRAAIIPRYSPTPKTLGVGEVAATVVVAVGALSVV